MLIPKDFYLVTAPDNDAGVAYAREYIKEMQLQPDQVRLFKDDGYVYVRTKKEITLGVAK